MQAPCRGNRGATRTTVGARKYTACAQPLSPPRRWGRRTSDRAAREGRSQLQQLLVDSGAPSHRTRASGSPPVLLANGVNSSHTVLVTKGSKRAEVSYGPEVCGQVLESSSPSDSLLAWLLAAMRPEVFRELGAPSAKGGVCYDLPPGRSASRAGRGAPSSQVATACRALHCIWRVRSWPPGGGPSRSTLGPASETQESNRMASSSPASGATVAVSRWIRWRLTGCACPAATVAAPRPPVLLSRRRNSGSSHPASLFTRSILTMVP